MSIGLLYALPISFKWLGSIEITIPGCWLIKNCHSVSGECHILVHETSLHNTSLWQIKSLRKESHISQTWCRLSTAASWCSGCCPGPLRFGRGLVGWGCTCNWGHLWSWTNTTWTLQVRNRENMPLTLAILYTKIT